ncbi:MAG: AAA family ATPase [Deltaproteobacteria bacterium]|nr:AAA family ATPase [Deltaproteobacteria bacterium]
MYTVAIANHKGGSGKTTTAVNLAASLAEMQYQVLLIDLDPQSHATLSFGVELETDEPSIFWAMGQENNDRALLAEIAMPVERGLSLVPSAPLPIHEEESLMGRRDRLLRLRELVAQIQKYDFVVIDCPPALGILTCNAFMASQAVLLPVETSFYAMHGVGRALEAIADLEKRYGHAVRHMAVATLFDRRTALARDILEELRRYFRGAMLDTVIHQSIHLREASSHGKPVTAYAPSSRGCRDYCDLAEEFLQRIGVTTGEVASGCSEEVVLLAQMYGNSRETIERLRDAGYTTLEGLRRAQAKKLAHHAGLSQHVARQMIRHATRMQGFTTSTRHRAPLPAEPRAVDLGEASVSPDNLQAVG